MQENCNGGNPHYAPSNRVRRFGGLNPDQTPDYGHNVYSVSILTPWSVACPHGQLASNVYYMHFSQYAHPMGSGRP